MADKKPDGDPIQIWRQMYDKSSEYWTKYLEEVMGTEAFGAAMGKYLDTYLSTQGQASRMTQQYMEQYLRSLNMPSRSDLTRVASLVVGLENKVDNVSDTIDEFQELKKLLQDLGDQNKRILHRVETTEQRLEELVTALPRVLELSTQLQDTHQRLDELSATFAHAMELPAKLEETQRRLTELSAALPLILDLQAQVVEEPRHEIAMLPQPESSQVPKEEPGNIPEKGSKKGSSKEKIESKS